MVSFDGRPSRDRLKGIEFTDYRMNARNRTGMPRIGRLFVNGQTWCSLHLPRASRQLMLMARLGEPEVVCESLALNADPMPCIVNRRLLKSIA